MWDEVEVEFKFDYIDLFVSDYYYYFKLAILCEVIGIYPYISKGVLLLLLLLFFKFID